MLFAENCPTSSDSLSSVDALILTGILGESLLGGYGVNACCVRMVGDSIKTNGQIFAFSSGEIRHEYPDAGSPCACT